MTAFTLGPHISDLPAWLKAHEGRTGSGDAYIVATKKPLFGRTVWNLYLRALGLEEKEDLSGVERIDLGNDLEPWVASRFTKETRTIVFPCGQILLRDVGDAPLCATPDYWLLDNGKPTGIVECKTAGTLAGWEEGVPEHYWCQVQHQLAVTGMKRAAIAILAGGIGGMKFRYQWIDRDDEWIDKTLIPAVSDFWRRVREKDPYPVDGSEDCGRSLGKLYPRVDPTLTVNLDGSFIDAANDFDEEALKTALAEWKAANP